MNKYAVMNTVFSAIGGAIIGGTIAILTTKRHYEEWANAEIEEVRRYYALIRKEDGSVQIFGQTNKTEREVQLEGELANANTLIRDLGYSEDEETAIQSARRHTIFDHAVSAAEAGPELTGPNGHPIQNPTDNVLDEHNPMLGYEFIPGEPYIISQEQMFNEETEWDKPTYSYYVGDNVLVDERENVTDATFRSKYIGERHLLMFGVLSDDENIVYVRSPQISQDFEIIREPGKYSVRVLGEPDYEEVNRIQESRRTRERDE